MWSVVVVGLILGLLWAYNWLGFGKEAEVELGRFPGGFYFYKHWRGDPFQVGLVKEALTSLEKEANMALDQACCLLPFQVCALLYDDPNNLINRALTRITIGVLFQERTHK